ncbi:MAG: TetR family transcriptional regulator [Clostridiales bacterium]|nr:TetR family transcriptional regulator [Clostridiales bacterium]
MPFERITIKDIVQNCDLSSTTFYHHFKDKYELVEWIYQNDNRHHIESISDSYTWKDAALQTLYTFHNEIDYYRSYFRSNKYAEDLNFTTYSFAIDTIRKLHGEESITDEVRFLIQLYFTGVTKMTIEWLMDEHTNISPEVFADRLMDAMPDKLKQLLF